LSLTIDPHLHLRLRSQTLTEYPDSIIPSYEPWLLATWFCFFWSQKPDLRTIQPLNELGPRGLYYIYQISYITSTYVAVRGDALSRLAACLIQGFDQIIKTCIMSLYNPLLLPYQYRYKHDSMK